MVKEYLLKPGKLELQRRQSLKIVKRTDLLNLQITYGIEHHIQTINTKTKKCDLHSDPF